MTKKNYKIEQQAARDSIRRVTPPEPLKAEWHDKQGNLTFEGQQALRMAQNGPQEHHMVNLGITGFKRMVNSIPMLSKGQRSEQIRKYKQKAWGDFAEIIKYKGSFPAHPSYV